MEIAGIAPGKYHVHETGLLELESWKDASVSSQFMFNKVEKFEEGFAALVNEIPAVYILERGKISADDTVANDHVGFSAPILAFMFCKTLREPEGKLERVFAADNGFNNTAVQHIEHQSVGEFMVDDMLELIQRAFPGNDHPVLKKLGESPDSLFDDFRQHIGLGKIVMRIVNENGDALPGRIPPMRGKAFE